MPKKSTTQPPSEPAKRTWTQRPDSLRAKKADSTRSALISAARNLFTEHGFHGVSVRDVTALAGVSRGALQHHFTDKEALFCAVFELVELELLEAAAHQTQQSTDPWTFFLGSIQGFLDVVASRRDVQRITLIDGPAVLGWVRWREIEERFSLGAFSAVLQVAMDAGRIRKRPVEPLAHVVLGSVMEAALLVANSENPKRRRREVGQALDDLLTGLQ